MNLNMAEASQSQRKCNDASDACLHLSHSEQLTSPNLNKCPFKWQCPVATPSLFLAGYAQMSNSSAFFLTGIFV